MKDRLEMVTNYNFRLKNKWYLHMWTSYIAKLTIDVINVVNYVKQT